VGRLGSVGVKTSFSFTHFDSVMDGSVPAASRLSPLGGLLTPEWLLKAFQAGFWAEE